MPATDVNVVELDVRSHLSKKLEPFQLIMDTVKGLRHEDIFVLHAPFKPTPLLGILKMKGYSSTSERLDSNHWVTTFVHKKNKSSADAITAAVSAGTSSAQDITSTSTSDSASNDAILTCYSLDNSNVDAECSGSPQAPTTVLDNRGLEPPQPMMRTLAALERCQPGEVIWIHNDRVPVFLIEELNQLGCLYIVEDQPDGTAKVRIEKR